MSYQTCFTVTNQPCKPLAYQATATSRPEPHMSAEQEPGLFSAFSSQRSPGVASGGDGEFLSPLFGPPLWAGIQRAPGGGGSCSSSSSTTLFSEPARSHSHSAQHEDLHPRRCRRCLCCYSRLCSGKGLLPELNAEEAGSHSFASLNTPRLPLLHASSPATSKHSLPPALPVDRLPFPASAVSGRRRRPATFMPR